MKIVWISLLIVHGCWSRYTEVTAFESELECRNYIEKQEERRTMFTEVQGQCASGEVLIQQQKDKREAI